MTFWGDWVRVLGGLGLLLYGMELAGSHLQLAAGRTLGRVMPGLSRSRWRGASVGALTAFLVNSSGVTGVVVVGLAGAGIPPLGGALAVMAGAGVGSALTVQLIAFKASRAGPLLVATGTVLGIPARGDRLRIWSRIVLAAGLVFWGMSLMTEGLQPASRNPALRELLTRAHGPLMGFLFGVAMTVATGSSSATLAFLMALVQSAELSPRFGAGSLVATFGAVLGANLGTCITPWVAARRASPSARQAAAAYLFYKTLLSLCLLPLAWRFSAGVLHLTQQVGTFGRPDAARVTANLHLAVNVLGVLLAVPCSDLLVRLAARFLPAPKEAEALIPRYLDPEALKTPELALVQARREILRFASTVREMLDESLEALRHGSPDLARRVAAKDERVDRLQRAVTTFLSDLMARTLTREESALAMALAGAADDLEAVGDVVVRDLLRLAAKKARLGQDFSEQGWGELKGYHAGVMWLFVSALEALEKEDRDAAEACLLRGEALLAEAADLRRSHISRLSAGLSESRETSAVHLDVLHALGQVTSRLVDLRRGVRETA